MHDAPAHSVPVPVFIAGPTAVGKSAVALHLAELIGGEIISVDSMQVYRGLDLGTAKPSPAEQARVRHHLVDVAELTETFDAACFLRLATAAVQTIQARGRTPIFCGGTGLYFSVWLNGLGEAPPTDPAMRTLLESTPLPELLAELEQRDPEAFARIDRENPRRVVRAVEVIRLTGRPFSTQRAAWPATPNPKLPTPIWCLSREPADLRGRIDARVDAMFAAGLLDETRALLERGLEHNRTAMQALGYRQAVEHLRGERGLAETIALVKTKTWQFARRQGTWFRRQLTVEAVPLAVDTDALTVAGQLAERFRTAAAGNHLPASHPVP